VFFDRLFSNRETRGFFSKFPFSGFRRRLIED
jgi:hypothetical protein